VVAGGKWLEVYSKIPGKPTFSAVVSAMDEQMGRLRAELDDLGIASNTMLWFQSDNGPAGVGGPQDAGPFRGAKTSLHEGGVRVPGLLVWPDRVKSPRIVKTPVVSSDYFPTVLAAVGFSERKKLLPLDGIDLIPLLDGAMEERPSPIAFESGQQLAFTDNQYKLISKNSGKTWELYDLVKDRGEKSDLASEQPDRVRRMSQALEVWRESVRRSATGVDYAIDQKK
jgi:arylsulfatase A-like enzyme